MSVLLVLVAAVVSSVVFAGTYYLWATRTTLLQVDEPLSITDCPTSIHVHPGENKTLDITIVNSATVNYSVTLVFALNDTAYEDSYVQFSNYTYNITPSTNNIGAWMVVESKAPPAWLEIIINFSRE